MKKYVFLFFVVWMGPAVSQGADDLSLNSRISQNGCLFAVPNVPEKVHEAAKSVVRVEVKDASTGDIVGVSSGFVVSPEYIFTAGHSINEENAVYSIVTYDCKRYLAKYVLHGNTPANIDVGVLKVAAGTLNNVPSLTFGSVKDVRIGDTVYALGISLGIVTSAFSGKVESLASLFESSSASVVPHIRASTPVRPGNSGGPLLDGYGKVIGITVMWKGGVSKDRNIVPKDGYFVPIDLARAWLSRKIKISNI